MSLKFRSFGSIPWMVFGLLLTAAFLVAPDLMAQDGAAAPAEDTAPATKSVLDTLISGGPWMIPIGVLSIGTITLYVFNALQLMKGRWVPKTLSHQILDLMSQVRVRSTIEVSAASPSFLGRMMATALPNVDATDPESLGREGVEDAIGEFTTRETSGQLVWIQYLSVIAQLAPMMGLLGTVVGMVGAFETLGTGKGSDPSKLAGDISVALLTTLGGLVVAMPSIFGYYFFRNKLNANIKDAHKLASDAMDAAIATVNAEQQMAKVPEGLAE